MIETKPMSAFKQFQNKIKDGFAGKGKQEKVKNIKAMRKQDLLLTTFYMNDFGEGGYNEEISRANRSLCMFYPEDKTKLRWDLFMIL